MIILTRSKLNLLYLLLGGMMAGYFWLSPVFVSPQLFYMQMDTSSIYNRVFRISFLCILLLPYIYRTKSISMKSVIFQISILLFFIITIICGVLSNDIDYIIYKCAPFVISGLLLMSISVLKDIEIKYLIIGICIVAIIYFSAGFLQHGLVASKIWGRVRVHLGFIHPMQTGSVLLTSSIFMFYLLLNIKHKVIKYSLMSCLFISSMYVLNIVDSRATTLAFLILTIGYIVFKFIHKPSTRFFIFLILIILINCLFIYSINYDYNDSSKFDVNRYSSGRIERLNYIFNQMYNNPVLNLIIGNNANSSYDDSSGTFGSSHSVIITLLLNFGVFSFIIFWILIYNIAYAISKIKNPFPYLLLSTCCTYYVTTTQGITASNLAIFLGFALAYRAAIKQNFTRV